MGSQRAGQDRVTNHRSKTNREPKKMTNQREQSPYELLLSRWWLFTGSVWPASPRSPSLSGLGWDQDGESLSFETSGLGAAV